VKKSKKRLLADATPIEGFAATAVKKRLGKFAPKLGTIEDVSAVSMRRENDRLPVDQNLDLANARAQANYQTSLVTEPMVTVQRLDAALLELNKAIGRVGEGRDAGKYAHLERLEKAKAAVVTARTAILAKVGHDSAGTDASFRAKASANSSVPGITRAADMIAALQRRQR